MEDRVISGAFSGIIGSCIQMVYGLITKSVGLTDRTFHDFGKIFFMYKNYKGFLALIVGVIVEITIGGMLGIIFAYLINHTSKKYYYLKGIGFGLATWLIFGITGTIFKLPLFKDIPPQPALITLIGALIFGFVTSYTFNFLRRKKCSFSNFFLTFL